MKNFYQRRPYISHYSFCWGGGQWAVVVTIFLYGLVILPVYQVTICIPTKRTKYWFQIIHKWGKFDERKKTWLKMYLNALYLFLYIQKGQELYQLFIFTAK